MGNRTFDKFDPTFQKVTERLVAAVASLRHGNRDPLLVVKMDSQGQAMNVAMQLRQYWKALDQALKAGSLQEYDPRYALALAAPMLAVRHRKGAKHVLELVHRSQLVTSQGLANALGILEEAVDTAREVSLAPAVTTRSAPTSLETSPVPQAASAVEDLVNQAYGTPGKGK